MPVRDPVKRGFASVRVSVVPSAERRASSL